MVISPSYGVIMTPSEENSNQTVTASALGGNFVLPSNLPSGNLVIAVNAYVTYNGAAGGGIGGTFDTFHQLRYGQRK